MLTSMKVWTCTSLHLNHTLNPRVPVFTEGRQLVRTTTNVRGCYHRNNSSVTTVTVNVNNSDWQQEESDNMETLTTQRIWQYTTLFSLRLRELALFHNTVTMSQFSPHKNNESVWLPNDSRITINTQTIYGPLYSSTQTLTINSLQ